MNRRALSSLAISMIVFGCGPQPEIQEYEVDRKDEKVFTSDLLRDQFPTIPFRWHVPEEWEPASNDQFSAVAWQVGPEITQARITASSLPGGAGIEPQITRWRGQLSLPTDGDAMQDVETLKLKGGEAFYIDIQNDSETILGMIVPADHQLWIFKYRSPNSTAKKQRERFRRFCESLEVVESEGS